MKKKLILLLLILSVFTGCRSKKHLGEEYPFHRGFEFVPWGATESTVDSALAKDSTWEKISRIDNSDTGGKIVVVRDTLREYFLEFDRKDRFFMMNYISDTGDVDTVRNHLKKYYGEPEQKKNSGETYQEQLWKVEADSVHLEIQILITQRQYALKVINKNIH
jgi:hypothetical protein